MINKWSPDTWRIKKAKHIPKYADEVKLITGFSIGGVSPVAHVNNLDVLIDKSLNRFKFRKTRNALLSPFLKESSSAPKKISFCWSKELEKPAIF